MTTVWGPLWSQKTRKRADSDRARKKAARKQHRHLLEIKSNTELRQMILASRARQTS